MASTSEKLTLAKAMSRFNVAQVEKDIAEKQYVAAAAAYEQARFQIHSKNVYLGSFLKPCPRPGGPLSS